MSDASPIPSTPSGRRYVVGITGASGALYAQRLIRLLLAGGHEVHLAITPYGHRLLKDELGHEGVNLHALGGLPEGSDPEAQRLFHYPTRDVGAAIGSGSFRHDGMVVIPCSSHTLNSVAMGVGDTLVTRAAAVALKERVKLILVHRESPLSHIDLESMLRLSTAGAIIAPANPGFYLLPTSIDEIVDFVVGRVLDLLGVAHALNVRWEDHVGQ
ncbi:MAG: UbiX family flavin prenyltransferase [Phycisphaerales bacterium]|nr:UbiX family flavin prenyltransferase [Phycisphaerales bacterium]